MKDVRQLGLVGGRVSRAVENVEPALGKVVNGDRGSVSIGMALMPSLTKP